MNVDMLVSTHGDAKQAGEVQMGLRMLKALYNKRSTCKLPEPLLLWSNIGTSECASDIEIYKEDIGQFKCSREVS